jgi:hypothetical protein
MNWAWAAPLDQIWHSPNLPLYLTLATAGFIGLVILITLLRSERSVANSVLALITLLAIGVAGAVTFRGYGTTATAAQPAESRPVQAATAPLPQLSCIDELAGDAVLAACEKVLFGSAESVAAAVAYAASQITLLTSLGDVATANKGAGSDLQALRRAVERDRYGLMAYVLMTRDRCTPSSCRAFRSLTETRQIASNMEERAYENLVMRYTASWNAPPQQAASGLLAALPPAMPTGKPTNAEFPTSANTPAVSIMSPEPPLAAPKPAPPPATAAAAPTAPAAAPRPAPPPAPAAAPAVAAAKKPPPAPKRPATTPPVQLAPSASAPVNTDNE